MSLKKFKLFLSRFSFNNKIFCANCTDVSSLVPLFIIIANNSAFVKFFSPYCSNFSYGLSVTGKFFILIGMLYSSFLFIFCICHTNLLLYFLTESPYYCVIIIHCFYVFFKYYFINIIIFKIHFYLILEILYIWKILFL